MSQSVRMRWVPFVLGLYLLASSAAHAQLTAIVAVEPTEKKAGHSILRSALEAGLSQATGQAVKVTTTEDLADVMRATRSAGFDIFIGPPQVAASALQRGYELVGCSQKSDHYVLVGLTQIETVAAMKGKRLYLPQQDSVYTYMARGMLNEAGLSFKDLKAVRHEKYPQAGLSALTLGTTDATVVRAEEWALWATTYPGVAKVLATSRPVPGGFSAVMRKDLPSDVRSKLSQWLSTASASAGLAPIGLRPEAQEYQKVAELGLFTPNALPGVKRITAKDALQLQAQGALVVDTRTEKEYRTKRIRGAVWAAYGEKSLKDVAFNAEQDDFKALESLDRTKPLIFSCNGAECWKSYKAARVAADKGFANVYWMRGGLPEWDAEGLPTEGG
ncbi:rhodanese-related sulfurtransferase [Acidovorax sp. 62]|uniref:PhnD/SsuA/transferrin family substrate-binding protein n=1 Tax=Acidovorax sp. 62 TaxID=2035203 RepID=UPI000C6016B8|nr:PhnD/SsuA/transferrin family substrate-binding protein [Acidovorax sp. 62]PIF92131.1 rhodanese-related sulfurtransferase [Acidovorax sp. 62]